MKRHLKSLLALLLAVTLILCLVSCGNSDDDGDSSSDDFVSLTIGTYASTTFVGPYDPTGSWAGTSAGFGQNYLVYDQLFMVDSNGEFVSRVVDEYNWEDDTTLVITLKDGIKYSNGDQLTGNDVLYSLGLAQNSGMRSGYYTAVNLENSSVSDDGLTVTLVYDEVYAPYMGGLDFAIVDEAFIEANGGGENMDWYDIASLNGSGPYTVKEYVQDAYTIYEKKSDYWGLEYGYDDPVDEWQVYNYTDQTTLGVDLETGAVDIALDISNSDYNRLSEGSVDNVNAELINGNATYQLVFDDENEVLKNEYVRAALCYSVDTSAFTEAVAGSYGVAATSTFAEGESFYSAGHSYSYDVEKAKEMLAQSGYAEGEITLNLPIISSEPYSSMAEALQAYFSAIGVNLTIDSFDFATFIQTQTTEGAASMQLYTMTGGNPYGEPHMHLDNWLQNSTCPVMSRNAEEPNTYIDNAVHTLSDEERAEWYDLLQDWWYDNYECIPLYEYLLGYGYNTDSVNDITFASTSMVYLYDIVPK